MAHPRFIFLASNLETQEASLPAGHCPAVTKSELHFVLHWRPPMTTTAARILLPQEAPLPPGYYPPVAKSVVSHLVPRWRPADDYNGSSHLNANMSPMDHPSILTLLASSPETDEAPLPPGHCIAVAKSVVSHLVPHWRPADFQYQRPADPATFFRPPASALLASPPCAFGSPSKLRLALLSPPLPRLLRPPASARLPSPPCAFIRTYAIPHVLSDRESSCFNQTYSSY